MNISRSAALAAAIGLSVSTANVAQAAFVLTIDDLSTGLPGGTPDVIVSDGVGIGSATSIGNTTVSDSGIGADGLIFFNGGVGNFTVNVVTGVSDPLLGPGQIDLNSINVTGGNGALRIKLTDTDYTGTVPAYTANYGGTTSGSVDFDFLHDSGNTEFGGTSFFDPALASGGAFSGSSSNAVNPGSPYSLTIEALISHTIGAGQISSFDAHLVPVPVPAAVWLFGSGLLGMVGIARRRRG